VNALSKKVKHTTGDKEQRLKSIEYWAGADIGFALQFQRLAKELGVK